MKNEFKYILTSFNLHPITMRTIKENVYHFNTMTGSYLLKELQFNAKKMESLQLTYRLAKKYKLKNILPLVMTTTGTVYLHLNQKLYTVSPWVEKSCINWRIIFQTIANIHQQTKINHKDSKPPIISKKRIEALRIRHLQWIELFERQAYMSPLELQVCTHYREIDFALKQLERLIIAIDKTEMDMGVCLIHGNFTRRSILGEELVYIANWESATYGNPTKDLLSLFKNEAMHFDKKMKEWLQEFFHYYLSKNPLSKAELYYLAIALLDIEKYLGIVDKYILTDNFGESMVRTTMELEETYYKIIIGLHYADALEEYLKNQIHSK